MAASRPDVGEAIAQLVLGHHGALGPGEAQLVELGAPEAAPTTGLFKGWPPFEPENVAVPKLKIPPSEATSQ